MARFLFRLASVLQLRETQHDECRTALAEAYSVDAVLKNQADALKREIDALKEFCRRKVSPGAVDINRLVEAQRYEMVARAQEQKIDEQRQQVAAEIERRFRWRDVRGCLV